jgi:1-deoxy-D-xylulose-5-phosphate reductoisomerase
MTPKKKGIAVLGSTGSVGTQALEVIHAFPEEFELVVITANENAELLIEQAKQYQPNTVVICDESRFEHVRDALWEDDIKVFTGAQSMESVVEMLEVDLVLTAVVGFAGLYPTLRAIEAGKHIAIANKETLVVAGDLVTRKAKEKGVNIYPVDSEHSAIFQCLVGEFHNPVEKIYLTASGGPFLGKTLDELKNVSKTEALNHPNWSMGDKITIDSATMMNKGLEVIEAYWLFGLSAEQIDVIVHPQSIVHSLVQFQDGSLKAQIGLPDMKLPIQYALSFPKRFTTDTPRFSFMDFPSWTFQQPDKKVFKNLDLAYQALERKGTAACALNAANEETVRLFLNDQIAFTQIADINEQVLNQIENILNPSLEDYVAVDNEARALALEIAKNRH